MLRITLGWLWIVVSAALFTMPLCAQEADISRILFTNVSVFNGKDDSLANVDVLVEGNKITKVARTISAPENTTVIDGAGRTLMPGIIEAHNHLMLAVDSASWFNTHDVFYIGAAAASEAKNYLMRGWTTVRDIGGPAEGLRRAIDDGRVVGPRIGRFARAMSTAGMPSVMHAVTSRPASAASRTASAAPGGGTKITEALAPVCRTASSTVLKTGIPSIS